MKKLFIPALALLFSASTFAASYEITPRHDYIQNPQSRAYLCYTMKNKDCGNNVPKDYQSIEGPKGFPAAGPKDGEIASGGNALFDVLNQQSSDRWHHVKLNSGKNKFTWTITKQHATTAMRFFITQENWDPNSPLARADFALTPFCQKEFEGALLGDVVKLECDVSSRSGYHVILGVWDIADTTKAFYQVIDADIKPLP